MNELQISVTLNSGSIVTNTEELKEQLSAKMAEYENAVFTEDSKAIAKAELTGLRKLREAVESRRKEIKAQCMIPYNEFEKEVKELTAIIDKPIHLIDGQLKEMEVERVRRKKEAIEELYQEVVTEVADYLPLNDIYDNKWENAGTSMKKIREAMEELVVKTVSEISIIKNNVSDARDEALRIYKDTRNLAKALEHINVYEENKKKVLELENAKKERAEAEKREEEIARIRAEERARVEELEKAKKETVLQKEETFFDTNEEEDDDSLPFAQPTTITAYYKVIALPEELEQVEMAFNSIGIYFERRDA